MLKETIEVMIISGNKIVLKQDEQGVFVYVSDINNPRYKAKFSISDNTVQQLDSTYPKGKNKEVIMDVINNLPFIQEEMECLR